MSSLQDPFVCKLRNCLESRKFFICAVTESPPNNRVSEAGYIVHNIRFGFGKQFARLQTIINQLNASKKKNPTQFIFEVKNKDSNNIF